MSLRIYLAAMIAIAGGVPAAAAEIAGTSRIDAVTVYPSGARITRLAKIKIAKGEHVIIFSDLAAQAMPGSIRVEGRSNGTLEIGSVDSRRVNVATTDAAVVASERRRIEDEILGLQDMRQGIEAQIRAARAQVTLMINLAQLPLRPPPPGGAQSGGAAATDWGQIYSIIGARLKDAEAVLLKARIEQRGIDRKIKDLKGKLAAVAPTQKVRTVVKVHVIAAAALEAELSIRYQVRRASWTPLYDARLGTGAKAVAPKLTLVRRASISQRSGEAWKNVKLALSTSQPAAGSTVPQLYPLTVDYERPRPPPAPMAMEQSRSLRRAFADKAESRKEFGASRAMAPARAKLKKVSRRQAVVKAAPFQAVFVVPGRQTIQQTGEAKRVEIDQASLEPTLLVHTVPKRLAKAFLYARFKLPKGTPYLPGQVQLFRDSTFVGTGHLPLLRPGQQHDLGFGQDDAVRVKYAIVKEKRGETGIISSTKTDLRSYKITIRNLHERAINIAVFDQVPVSKNQDIRVELTGRTPPTKRDVKDRRGVYAWETKMRSDAELVIDFGYRISWPAGKQIRYGR